MNDNTLIKVSGLKKHFTGGSVKALDGIDMIFFGPADFTQGIGAPCDFADERVNYTRELIAKTARKFGKFAGTTGSADNIAELYEMGYQFVNITADVVALANNYQSLINKAKTNLEEK